MAQELLTTFSAELQSVTLQPSDQNGEFYFMVGERKIFDRKAFGGFPEIKELKQLVRDAVCPGKSLGHSNSKQHQPIGE